MIEKKDEQALSTNVQGYISSFTSCCNKWSVSTPCLSFFRTSNSWCNLIVTNKTVNWLQQYCVSPHCTCHWAACCKRGCHHSLWQHLCQFCAHATRTPRANSRHKLSSSRPEKVLDLDIGSSSPVTSQILVQCSIRSCGRVERDIMQ